MKMLLLSRRELYANWVFFNLKQRSEHVACANAQVPVLLLPLAPNVL